ncbi:ATP-grasp domain-containing protein [uncultured Microbulbifer sp.]|uniref:ATP-grasp domain-containing protein n=1 Tax=uncultured Microbulbifer sp. TaxID=348147 RepID=UPI002625F2EE|nr:ATP-grasp domain-containing protein [uncultured Microbulbifer sp.]
MTTVVFIETNFSGLDAILYCKSKGYKSVLVSDSHERFKKWFPKSCMYKLDQVDQLIQVGNSNDISEVKQALQDNLDRVDAVLTFAEIRTEMTARLARDLELRGPDPESIRIAQDKYCFREVLSEKGADDVGCIKVDTAEQLAAAKNDIAYPCFIKPVQGHSSIGAVVCRGVDDMEALAGKLSGIDEDWISKAFVVEDYLQGKLVSVEILTLGEGVHQVVGIADRDLINDCVEVGASFPLQNPLAEQIEKKACAALDAIGYHHGPSHVEMMITEAGPHLVEINTRVGGSGHSIMQDLATGRSIVGDCVELCLGNLDAGERLYEHRKGAAWKCLVSSESGVLEALPTEEEIAELPGVEHVWLHKGAGEKIEAASSNYHWILQVMCSGKYQAQAKKNADNAIGRAAELTRIRKA